MNELRLNEWREVKARASSMSFQRDILGSLPIEIVALVAGHMDMADMIRLQRVGRPDWFSQSRADPGRSRGDGNKSSLQLQSAWPPSEPIWVKQR